MSSSKSPVYPSLQLQSAPSSAASATSKAPSAVDKVYDLKGLVFSMLTMRLRSLDHAAIETQLRDELTALPDFFSEPLVLDFGSVGADATIDLPALLAMLRALGVAPVGLCNCGDTLRLAARNAGIAVLEGGGPAKRRPTAEAQKQEPIAPRQQTPDAPTPETQNPETQNPQATKPVAPPTHIVYAPVRAGQRVFAMEGDLTLMEGVNAGAEVLAVGSIHAYGPLRGRALAGVNGDASARIFTRSMEAELVSIAGAFRVIEEDLGPTIQGKPAQVYLDGERIIIAAL